MRHTTYLYYRSVLPLFLLIVVVSQQSGTHVSTNVETTGTSTVNVQTNVNTSGSESTVYKKVEVDVNGVKKVYESTDPGSEEINVSSDGNGVEVKVEKKDVDKAATQSATKIEVESSLGDKQDPLPYSFTYTTLREYVRNFVKNLFSGFFS